jgi:hypothetical protein
MPYGFEYDVNDGHENNFGHWQQSDGSVTTGSYRVQLPDGRTQIVTYRADENGYNAQVTYEPTAAIKPLSYRTTTTTTPPPPRPLYEFPGIPPYHGPTNAHGAYHQQSTSSSSSNSYGSIGTNSFNYYETAADATSPTSGTAAPPYSSDDGSDESIITENPIPLLFRSNLYGDISRIPLGYRSTSLNSKRSPPSSIWSPEQQQPQGAVNISKALDTRGDVEQFHDENDKQVESPSDDSSASTHLNNAVVDFDHLPFPLPVPLAFRSV